MILAERARASLLSENLPCASGGQDRVRASRRKAASTAIVIEESHVFSVLMHEPGKPCGEQRCTPIPATEGLKCG
jgi:hypothetical protein